MTAKKQSEREIKLDKKPQTLKKLGLEFSDDEFILVFEYDELINTKTVEKQLALTVSPDGLKRLIMGLFEGGKMYQEQLNKDIGFGGTEEE